MKKICPSLKKFILTGVDEVLIKPADTLKQSVSSGDFMALQAWNKRWEGILCKVDKELSLKGSFFPGIFFPQHEMVPVTNVILPTGSGLNEANKSSWLFLQMKVQNFLPKIHMIFKELGNHLDNGNKSQCFIMAITWQKNFSTLLHKWIELISKMTDHLAEFSHFDAVAMPHSENRKDFNFVKVGNFRWIVYWNGIVWL